MNTTEKNQYVISRFGMSPECVRFVSGKFFLNDSGMTIKTENSILTEYIGIFLYSQQANIYLMGRGTSQKNIDMEVFKEFKIPFPPQKIQQKIIDECEKIDKEYENTRMSIEAYRGKIAQIFHDLEVLDKNIARGVFLESQLIRVDGDITKIGLKEIFEKGKYPVITQEVDNFIAGYSDNYNPITDLPLIVFGDHNCTFKYVDFPFLRGADGTQLIKVDREKWDTKFLYFYLRTQRIENSEKYERHFKYLKNIKIPNIALEIQ